MEIENIIKGKDDPVYFIDKFITPLKEEEKEIIYGYYNNKLILSGHSRLVLLYSLYCIFFKDNFTIAILFPDLKNSSTAIRLFLHLYDSVYPFESYLQPKIIKNKVNCIEFDNFSSIHFNKMSSCAVRGMTMDIIYLSEFDKVPLDNQKNLLDTILPAVSSRKTSKIIIDTVKCSYV